MSRERASLQVLPPLGGGGVGAMMDYGFMSQILCILYRIYFEFRACGEGVGPRGLRRKYVGTYHTPKYIYIVVIVGTYIAACRMNFHNT